MTTVGNMTFQRHGETLRDALARDLAAAEADAAIDYILHPVLTDPSTEALAQITQLAAEGHTSLKIFLLSDNFDAREDDYLRAMQLAGRSGSLTMLHCEDYALFRSICSQLIAQGMGAPRYWPDARPDYTESVATERAIAMARATKAPIYIVHLSSTAALRSCSRARAEGLRVYVETRPLYLYLTREVFNQPDSAKYASAPPLREQDDLRAMWDGLRSGAIQCVCTDHAPWSLRQKLDPTLDIRTAHGGVRRLGNAHADAVLRRSMEGGGSHSPASLNSPAPTLPNFSGCIRRKEPSQLVPMPTLSCGMQMRVVSSTELHCSQKPSIPSMMGAK